MPITSPDILEIRDRVADLIKEIKINISEPVPERGKAINPGERFTFKVEASNPHNLNFKNVRWEVEVPKPHDFDQLACLIVPDAPVVAKKSKDGATIPPGTCVPKLVLFYPAIDPRSQLSPKGTTEIKLEAIANEEIDDNVKGYIEAKINVDIDLDYLFAFGAASQKGDQDLEVVT